jgi:hypothetical protein
MGWSWEYNIDQYGMCRVSLTQRYKNEAYVVEQFFTLDDLSDIEFFPMWFSEVVMMMWRNMKG